MTRLHRFLEPYLRIPLAIGLGFLFSYSAFYSIRLAYADVLANTGTVDDLNRAIELAPGNPAYFLASAEASPIQALPAIDQAIRLDPVNPTLWIKSSAIAEAQDDLPRAENALRQAIALDATFAPRWLLAEFYGRHHDQARFWPALRIALATSYDDITPLFELAWSLAPDPAAIFDRIIPDPPAPNRESVTSQYLDFLVSRNRLDLAPPVAARLLANPSRESAHSLLAYCDRLLWFNRPGPLEVWNTLAAHRLIPYPALHPETGLSLTNPTFTVPPLAQAFDWRIASSSGIFIDAGAPLRLDFSGKQPESSDLLSQFVPLLPGRTYRLTTTYETRGISSNSGLRYHLLSDGVDLLRDSASLPSSELQSGTAGFDFTANRPFARLQLRYERTLGTVRVEGSLTLYKLALRITK